MPATIGTLIRAMSLPLGTMTLAVMYATAHAVVGVDGGGVAAVAATAALKAAPIWLLAFSTRTRIIALGLCLSSVGDFLLEFDNFLGVASPETAAGIPPDLFFIGGLASFLIAHVCYIVDFAGRPGGMSGGVGGAAALAVGVGLVAYLWDGVPEPLRPPVVVYAGVIATMAYTAVGGARFPKAAKGRSDALLGALFFVVSDSILAADRFKAPKEWHTNCTIAVMVTYYAAQLKIAQSGSA